MKEEAQKDKYLKSVYIADVRVDILTRKSFIALLDKLLQEGKSGYIVTPYSEFFYNAQTDTYFKEVLNKSIISIPDGIFTLWGAKYLSIPASKYSFVRLIQSLVQYIITGASIIISPKSVQTIIKERIPGSEVVYDISALAAERGYKIAILGGYDFGQGNTGVIAAEKLKGLYPDLQITEIYPGDREKEEFGEPVIKALKDSHADILFCCYGPIRQEKWLYENLQKTNIKFGLGLGGTLDYVSGIKQPAPPLFKRLGLEWLVRPFYADRRSKDQMKKRMKRAWIPAMIKSSLLLLSQKINGAVLVRSERKV